MAPGRPPGPSTATTDATTTSITISIPGGNAGAVGQAFAESNTPKIQAQVRATNNEGNGDWSAQPPDAPAPPTVVVWNEQLNVSWTAPADNGATITDYDVRYCDNSTGCDAAGEWTELDDTGNNGSDTATSATVSSLTNGTAYQVQVQATNKEGDSGWSASSTGTPAAQKPGQPDAPTVTPQSQSLEVSWTEPVDTGGDAITGYGVRYCDNSTGCDAANDWTTKTLTGTGTSTTLSSLTNGTAYQVQVQATNSVGDSAWSAISKGTPTTGSAPAPEPPDAPDAPRVIVLNQALWVSWTAPAINGSPITGYSVRYRITDTDDTLTGNQAGAWTYEGHTDTSTGTVIESLTNGVSYQVRVLARSADGDSAWSDSTEATPTAQKPDTPVAPTVIVWNQSLRVSWTAPNSNGATVTDFDLQWRACTATDKTCATSPSWGSWTDRGGETTPDTATTATISSLTNDTAYQIQVRAANTAGESEWSLSTTGTPTAQRPAKPAAPTLTYGDLSLGVSWSAPVDNGSAITDYDVRYCVNSTGCDAASEWTALDDSGNNGTNTTRTAPISGLTNGTSYQVQVRAGNSVGDGAWSDSATEYPSTVPGTPGTPTLTVQDISLDVSWGAV